MPSKPSEAYTLIEEGSTGHHIPLGTVTADNMRSANKIEKTTRIDIHRS